MTTRALLLALLALVAPAQAGAQVEDFPNRAVRIVVGFPPGGSTDVSSRIVAEQMAKDWKQPVIVDNKPGAASTIAAAFVAAAPADGYTLFNVGPGTHGTTAALYKQLPYDAIRSFVGAGMIATQPFVVVVAADSKTRSLRDLIDDAKARPGQVPYGSTGSGGGPHLVAEVVAASTGVRFLHVPFKGAAPAAAAAVASQVEFAMVDASAALPFVAGGKLRALAVSSPKRSDLFAGVPTIAEAAVPGFSYPSSVGLAAPAGTPREVVLRINAALNRALAEPAVRERLRAIGLEAAPMGADEFNAFLGDEVRKYARVVRDLGLKLD